MKKNPFKKNSVITTVVSVLGAGAGSAGADWLLERFGIIDDSWEKSTVNAVKLVAGAAAGAMIPANSGMFYMVAKSACDGIATVAAHNLVADMLPAATEEPAPKGNEDGTSGLPYGTIGATRRKLGQRTWRKVNGVGNASFMGA